MSLAGRLDLGGHAYARLGAGRLERQARPTYRSGATLFVDIALGLGRNLPRRTLEKALRTVPPELLNDLGHLVVRSPRLTLQRQSEGELELVAPGATTAQTEIADDLGLLAPDEFAQAITEALARVGYRQLDVLVVEHPVGGPPQLMDVEGATPANAEEILAVSRASELACLLHWEEAIWRPRSYHYQLPSGHHAAAFVRIAEIFRDPRAAAALATWLRPGVGEGTVVVLDTGTLVPIVSALGLVAERAGRPVLHTVAMESYPRSAYEARRAFVEHTTAGLDILGLLSVSSTGRTHQWLRRAIELTEPDTWRTECLVTRVGPEAAASGVPTTEVAHGQQAPWLSVDDLVEPTSSVDCRHCRNESRSPVVRIHPRTFSPLVLPEPTLEMPSIWDARRNASLWGHLEAARLQGIRLVPSESTRPQPHPELRVATESRLRFEPTVLAELSLEEVVVRRVDELSALSVLDKDRQPVEGALARVQGSAASTAVVSQSEADLLGDEWEEMVLSVVRGLGITSVERAVTDEELHQLEDERDLVVVAFGMRTGLTIQQVVVRIGDAVAAGEKPELHGVVLHAHPETFSGWRAVRNSFRDSDGYARVVALWLTYVSGESPLAEEFRVLETIETDGLSEAAMAVYEQRLRYTKLAAGRANEDEVADVEPLWTPREVSLRRSSYLGDRLGCRGTLAAVGAAMQRTREDWRDRGAPGWLAFDMPNIFRSYFDGLIHAAVLRWITPSETWWGAHDSDCVALLAEIEGRAEEDWKLLLPELLLAAGLGKLPRDAVDHVVNVGRRVCQQGEWDVEELAHVELGVRVAELATDPRSTT